MQEHNGGGYEVRDCRFFLYVFVVISLSSGLKASDYYINIWKTVRTSDLYHSVKSPLPYVVKGEVCEGWKPDAEAVRALAALRYGAEITPVCGGCDSSIKLRKDVSKLYLKQLSESESVPAEKRAQAMLLANALCHYDQYKIPRATFSVGLFEQLLSVKHLNDDDGTRGNVVDTLDEGEIAIDDISIRKTIFEFGMSSLTGSGNYILPDKFFITRLSDFLISLRTVLGKENVLYLGAGRGLVASGLRRKGIKITAIDDYSYGIKRNPNVLEYDAIKAIEKFKGANVYLIINPLDNSTDIINKILVSNGKKNILIILIKKNAYANWNTFPESKTYRGDNNDLISFDKQKLALQAPSIYGPLQAVVMYYGPGGYDEQKTKTNIQKIKTEIETVEKLRKKQTKLSSDFNAKYLSEPELFRNVSWWWTDSWLRTYPPERDEL